MALQVLNWESLADGTVITSGSAAALGVDVVSTTGGSMEIDDDISFAQYGHSRSVRVLPSATSSSNYLQRTTGINNPTLAVVGVFDIDVGTVGVPVIWVGSTSVTRAFVIQLRTDGRLEVYNSANGIIYTSTGAIPAGTSLVRIAAWATWSGGRIRVAAYSGDSSTPISGMDSGDPAAGGIPAGQSIGSANYGAIRWGKSLSGTYASPFNMGYLGWDDSEILISAPVLGPIAVLVPSSLYQLLDASTSSRYETLALSPMTNVYRVGDAFLVPVPETDPVTYTLTATNAVGTHQYPLTVQPNAGGSGIRILYFDGVTLQG